MQICDSELRDCEWDDDRVSEWIDRICQLTIEELHSARKPYKYMVTCALMQRTGQALNSAKSAVWDGVTDGSVTVIWPKRNANEASRSIVAVVTVFATAFYVN